MLVFHWQPRFLVKVAFSLLHLAASLVIVLHFVFESAGSLGSSFLDYLLDNRLLVHSKNKSRVMFLTEQGR